MSLLFSLKQVVQAIAEKNLVWKRATARVWMLPETLHKFDQTCASVLSALSALLAACLQPDQAPPWIIL
jgi:hypothetical protein